MSINNDSEQLVNTVIKGNYCIGCGGCASLKNSSFKIKLDKYGRYQAIYIPNKEDSNQYLKRCPFAEKAKNETDIGRVKFKQESKFNDKLGFYINTYTGYVLEDHYRKNGSSGGLGSWILNELMKNKMVDYVIHVDKSGQSEPLFKYKISNNFSGVRHGSSSIYYPIELSEVLQIVKNQKGRYAIIGIPCFIKSIRLLTENNPIIKDRIKYLVGLVCGHLKTTKFADMIARQMGINPKDIVCINFRKKIEGQPANDYAAEISYVRNGEIITVHKNMKDIYGGNWGYGFFKYNACDYCDDVLAETSDVTIGDAWLPEYIKDSKGTNIIITRNKEIDNLFRRAFYANRIYLQNINIDRVIKSQAGGFRHRRDGLAYRLWLKKRNNEWAPIKRVRPSANDLSLIDKLIFKMRSLISHRSIQYYSQSDIKKNIKYYIIRMKFYTLIYKSTYKFLDIYNGYIFYLKKNKYY